MNTRIRFARGKNSTIIADNTTSTAGHPIYNTDKKYLYVGDDKTTIKLNEPITTNRIEGWTTNSNLNFDVPDYALYGDTYGMILKQSGNKYIKFNINNKDVFQITSAGLVIADADRDNIKFIGNLQGNADTASYADNVFWENLNDKSDGTDLPSDSVGFKIGSNTYRHTITGVANASNVSSTINGTSVNTIFESDKKTVKNATNAVNATTADTTTYYKTFNSTLTELAAENVAINPFTYYKVSGSTYKINLTLNSSGKTNVLDEYLFEFTTSVGQPLKLTFSDSAVSLANDWSVADFEQGKTYLLYIINKKVFVSSL